MVHKRTCLAAMVAMLFFATTAVFAADAEIENLRKEIEDLRKRLNASSGSSIGRSSVDKAMDSKYGPNAGVVTKAGKLTISGLVQVWYYQIDNDNQGLFDDPNINGISDTNEGQDNDSFRVRRTELKFSMEIHENITAVVMIDPSREATSFPLVTQNQGLYKRRNNIAPEFVDNADGSTANIAAVQSGSGAVPRLLQDAYINYHGVIPCHDFTIGQFKPAFGEEGIRSSANLEFIERSFIGIVGDLRDTGVQVHGTFWEDRFQYWAGIFNGAGNYYGSGGDQQNRSDDNDAKDVVARVLVRPIWDEECEDWGRLELGYSFQFGTKGEASGEDPAGAPINGLNRNETSALRHAAWLSYHAGGSVRGLWLRGEWAYIRDRNAPGTVIDLLDSGNATLVQTNGGTFSSSGWYAAIGYKLADSVFADDCSSWLTPWEIALRYQTYENVQVADLVNNEHTDNFSTDVFTVGLNYYIKGHNAKIQLNYNMVNNPDGDDQGGNREFHDVDNNSFVVNFQVAF
jgi:hypothetical protein